MSSLAPPKPSRRNFFLKTLVIIAAPLFLFFVKEPSSQIIPKTAEPERFDQRFQKPLRPKSALELEAPEIPEVLSPSKIKKIRFVLTGVVVEGSAVYKDSDFLPLYSGFLGREISLVEVYQIAAAITAQYRGDGYILSRALVPPQTVENGIVRIKIIEGSADLDITGP